MSTFNGEEKQQQPYGLVPRYPDDVSCMSKRQHITQTSLLTALRRLRTEQIEKSLPVKQ